MENKAPEYKVLKTLITIIDYEYEQELLKLFNENHIPFNLITHGQGTASSYILDYLGLGETKKFVIISIIPDYKTSKIFDLLENKMHFNKPGRGIAFTIAVTGISSIICKIIAEQENRMDIKNEYEVNPMKQEQLYELVVTIVNQGYSDQVMDAAKEVGATGGTVVHARGLGSQEATKFLGISIQEDKELVLILAKKENKKSIMENICKTTGLNSPGKGITFSLPVDEQMGLN